MRSLNKTKCLPNEFHERLYDANAFHPGHPPKAPTTCSKLTRNHFVIGLFATLMTVFLIILCWAELGYRADQQRRKLAVRPKCIKQGTNFVKNTRAKDASKTDEELRDYLRNKGLTEEELDAVFLSECPVEETPQAAEQMFDTYLKEQIKGTGLEGNKVFIDKYVSHMTSKYKRNKHNYYNAQMFWDRSLKWISKVIEQEKPLKDPRIANRMKEGVMVTWAKNTRMMGKMNDPEHVTIKAEQGREGVLKAEEDCFSFDKVLDKYKDPSGAEWLLLGLSGNGQTMRDRWIRLYTETDKRPSRPAGTDYADTRCFLEYLRFNSKGMSELGENEVNWEDFSDVPQLRVSPEKAEEIRCEIRESNKAYIDCYIGTDAANRAEKYEKSIVTWGKWVAKAQKLAKNLHDGEKSENRKIVKCANCSVAGSETKELRWCIRCRGEYDMEPFEGDTFYCGPRCRKAHKKVHQDVNKSGKLACRKKFMLDEMSDNNFRLRFS